MKNYLFILSLLFAVSSMSAITMESAPEKRFPVNMTVTATNGYDITATGDCGAFTFQGITPPPSGNDPNPTVSAGQLQNIVESIINSNYP